jgi:hypothetical protein
MTSITALKLSTGAALLSLAFLPVQRALAQAQAQADETATPPPAAQTPATPVPASPAADTPAPPTQDPAIPASTAPRHRASGRNQRPTLDDRIAILSKNLELTEAQRSAVKKILVQRQEQTLRIRNSAEPGNVRVGQFRALQDQTVNQIRAILTDEQKKKYDPLALRKIPAPDTPQRSLEDWIKATTPRLEH